MDPENLTGDARLAGVLEHDGQQLPVSVACASRISLYVAFQGRVPPDHTVFPRLRIQAQDHTFELSSCRLHVEYTRTGFAGRLVFLEDVYDCKALLFEHKFIDLKAVFENLPVVIGQKERIRPEFRDYVASTMYDLHVFKRFFDEQDRIFANEPKHVADVAQTALIQAEGKRFFQAFDQHLGDLSALVKGYDKADHERHGFYLRRHAWDFILGSEFLKRTNLKPRGYPGDAEMMQMLYENRYVGNYVFNKLMHKHPVETAAAQAVRNRRHLIAREARRVLATFPNAERGGFRMLSVACGPAWELQDILLGSEDFERVQVSLLDQDPFALEASRATVHRIQAMRGRDIAVRWYNESVRIMLRDPKFLERFGRHHFIYSMGLFDYLTPPVARAILTKMYEMLEPGGTMLVGNFHSTMPTRLYLEYWMDWVLYYRGEEEFLALTSDLPRARTDVFFEGTGSQMFLRVEKEG